MNTGEKKSKIKFITNLSLLEHIETGRTFQSMKEQTAPNFQ